MPRLVLLLVVLLSTPVWAGSPIPPFPADGVAVGPGVQDVYGGLRDFLGRFQSAAGASYHVCVVGLTDPQDRAGRQYAPSAIPYAEQVQRAWQGQLDPARSVVLVLALENRGIAMQAGSRWVAQGFERQRVTEVIDGSSFATYARAGDFAQASERLIEAVDLHLALLQRRQEDQRQQVSAALEQLRASGVELIAGARGQQLELTAIQEHLAAAEAALTLAAGALARERDADAAAALEQARASYAAAEADVTRQHAVRALRASAPHDLARARTRRDEVAKRLGAVPFEDAELSTWLTTIDDGLARAELTMLEDPALAVPALKELAESADRLNGSIDRALAAHRFRTRTLPLYGALGLTGLVVIALVAIGLVRRGRRREVERLFLRWRQKLQHAATRLLALEDEHPFLFGTEGLEERFEGQTADVYLAMGRGVDDLFLGYAAAQHRLLWAERLAASSPLLSWAGFDRALELLTEEPVEVGNVREQVPKLFLPDVQVSKQKPDELLRGLSKGFKRVQAQVTQLEQTIRILPQRLREVLERLSGLGIRLRRVERRGVEVNPYEQARAELEVRHERARQQGLSDPVAALSGAGELSQAAEVLGQRVQRVADTAERLEAVSTRRDELAARLDALRADGLRLEEPGFEPAALQVASAEAAGLSLAAAEAGHDERGAELAAAAAGKQAELTRLIDSTLSAREQAPQRLKAGTTRESELRQLLPERSQRLLQLRQLHADAALQPALDNVQQATLALDFAARCLSEASVASQSETQRYLAGAELLSRAAQTLDQVQALYLEIEAKAAALTQAQAAAESGVRTAGACEATIGGLVQQAGLDFLSRRTVADRQALLGRHAAETTALGTRQPNWFLRQAAALALAAEGQRLLARVQTELAAYRAAQEAEPRVAALEEEVRRYLRDHDEDRPSANDRFREAERLFATGRERLTELHADWPGIEDVFRHAERGFDDALARAKLDVDKARAARSAIAQAQDAIHDADRSYSHGVRARLRPAESELDGARSSLRARDYEGARAEADRARSSAEDAEREARNKAYRKERREQERRRRREQRERDARAAASAASFNSSRSFGSSHSSSFGSSFGGSSSGGGSSYGGNAGGSSW